MANPKRRTSVKRKKSRRSHHALTATAAGACSNCGATSRPHRVCDECGYYNGRQVAPAKEA